MLLVTVLPVASPEPEEGGQSPLQGRQPLSLATVPVLKDGAVHGEPPAALSPHGLGVDGLQPCCGGEAAATLAQASLGLGQAQAAGGSVPFPRPMKCGCGNLSGLVSHLGHVHLCALGFCNQTGAGEGLCVLLSLAGIFISHPSSNELLQSIFSPPAPPSHQVSRKFVHVGGGERETSCVLRLFCCTARGKPSLIHSGKWTPEQLRCWNVSEGLRKLHPAKTDCWTIPPPPPHPTPWNTSLFKQNF